LDFAYDIHSKLGAKAIGAKVNHSMASIYDELHNGDQVDILTSEGVNPTLEWLDHVITAKAKQAIKNFLKRYRQNNIERGMTLFETQMQELGITPSARVFRKVLPAYGCHTKDEFYSKLGADMFSLDNIQEILRQNSAMKLLKFWTFFVKDKEEEQDNISADEARSQFDTAECCTPIPGDNVTGYKDPETGRIIVHKTNCHRLRKLAAQHGKNLVSNISWSSYKEVSYLTVIEIQGIDRMGMLLDLSQVITGQHNINIRELKMQSHDGIFEGYISIYVTNTEDLAKVINRIKQIKGIERVTRRENIVENG
jgi:GTP pyrophosphokinase